MSLVVRMHAGARWVQHEDGGRQNPSVAECNANRAVLWAAQSNTGTQT